MATVRVGYPLSGYTCFAYRYREAILKTCLILFPRRFPVDVFSAPFFGVPWLLLLLLYKCRQRGSTGYSFIDSKKPEAGPAKQKSSPRVFQGFARKGEGSTGV